MVHGAEITGCAISKGSEFHRCFVDLLCEHRNAAINRFLGMNEPIGMRALKLDHHLAKEHSTKCGDQRIAEGGEHCVSGQFRSWPDHERREKGKERPEETHIVERVGKLDSVLLGKDIPVAGIGHQEHHQNQYCHRWGELRERGVCESGNTCECGAQPRGSKLDVTLHRRIVTWKPAFFEILRDWHWPVERYR